MTRSRQAAVLLCALRVGYGVALAAAPGRLSRSWLGADGARAGGRVAVRGLAARDALIHAAALAAVVRGTPVRPWLAVSVAGDLGDVAATVAARSDLPDGAARATALVAGGSALVTLLAAAPLER